MNNTVETQKQGSESSETREPAGSETQKPSSGGGGKSDLPPEGVKKCSCSCGGGKSEPPPECVKKCSCSCGGEKSECVKKCSECVKKCSCSCGGGKSDPPPECVKKCSCSCGGGKSECVKKCSCGGGNRKSGSGLGGCLDMQDWVKAILAAIIAATSILLATNPPGGVVQASLSGVAFLIFNTISFIASLIVFLLILSGIPHKCKKFPKWLLPTVIGIAVTSLALTYLFATSMVTTTSIWASVVGIGFGVVLVVLVTLAIVWCCCSGCSGSDP